MPPAKAPKTSRRMAERHEILFPKLQALTRQVEAMARRKPEQAVPEKLRTEAEALLFDAELFRQKMRGSAPPVAAPRMDGLAAQLAGAMTVLLGFEARYTQWDARFNEPVWKVPDVIMKIRRLAPRPGSKAALRADAQAEADKAKQAARMIELRRRLVIRLSQFDRREPAPEPPVALKAESPEINLSPGPRIR